MLHLLGDELIGSPRLAVFELVKNAYDADATAVVVRVDLSSGVEPTITVTDDGDGMSLDLIRSVWLVPGDDHRRRLREDWLRSKRYRRLPLGEKGLGRFTAHQSCKWIRVTTSRPRNFFGEAATGGITQSASRGSKRRTHGPC